MFGISITVVSLFTGLAAAPAVPTLLRALVVAAPGRAAPETPTLAAARRAYDDGRYADAAPMFAALRERNLIAADRQEALKLEAFCLYMLGNRDGARQVWRELLTVAPDFRLDPDLDSPIFVTFFSPIKAPPTTAAPQSQPRVEPAPTPPHLDPSAQPPPAERGCGVVLCLLPFGVGQFANDRPAKAVAFLSLEALFLGANLGIQIHRDAQFRATGTVDPDTEQTLVIVQNTALGLLVLSAVVGVVDAFVFY